jgi:hypothetical protein
MFLKNERAEDPRRPKLNLEQYEQLKAEKERLEAAVMEQAAELALLKKRSLGLNGDLKGKYISEETKGVLVELIAHVHKKHCCPSGTVVRSSILM